MMNVGEDHEGGVSVNGDNNHNKKRSGGGGNGVKKGAAAGGSASGGSSMRGCQAEKCSADLSNAKQYHKRHKVCEHHAKAQVVIVSGIRQRFCQQCSRFHEVSEFDEAKRSCRRRLAGHNERRRKNSSSSFDSHAEGGSSSLTSNRKVTAASGSGSSNDQLNEVSCGQINSQENANFKHFQIR